MTNSKDKSKNYKVKILKNSVKYYLPRVEGYLEVIRKLVSEYSGMSLIEFDGYFEKKFEPVKYVRAEAHTDEVDEEKIMDFADFIRKMLKQKSLAIEYNNRLILVEE
ncbi:MAG: hypothetical protein ACTHKK_10375 [Candidatus Nitrosocosmicus sp.]